MRLPVEFRPKHDKFLLEAGLFRARKVCLAVGRAEQMHRSVLVFGMTSLEHEPQLT